MNPLQVHLLMFYQSDPGAIRIPLIEFLRDYKKQFDCAAHPRWRNLDHVTEVLGRAFPILTLEGRAMICNLAPKRMDWPYIGQIEELEEVAA